MRRAVEAEVELVVGVLALERDQHGRVGLVLDRDVVVGLAAALPALRAQAGGRLRVGLDHQPELGGGRGAALRLGVRDDLQVPELRLGLGRARRVEVDLHLLLVGAAGAERDEVDGVGVDRPPVVGHPLDAQLVVVDDRALVADQRHDAVALAGLDREPERVLVVGLAVGHAQRDARGLGLGRRRLRGLRRRRGRDGHGLLDGGLRAPARRGGWAGAGGGAVALPPSGSPVVRPLPFPFPGPWAGGASGSGRWVTTGSCGCGAAGAGAGAAAGGGGACAAGVSAAGAAASAAACAAISGVIAWTYPVGSQRRYSPHSQKSRSGGFWSPQLWQVLMTCLSSSVPSPSGGRKFLPACAALCNARSRPAPPPAPACRSRR